MSIPAVHHIYVDGLVQSDVRSACACCSTPWNHSCWMSGLAALYPTNWAPLAESHGILDAVTILVRQKIIGVIICDSNDAFLTLYFPRPVCGHVVRDILCPLANAHDVSLVMPFVWMPTHIWLVGYDTVNGFAKTAWMLDVDDMFGEPSLWHQRDTINSAGFSLAMLKRGPTACQCSTTTTFFTAATRNADMCSWCTECCE